MKQDTTQAYGGPVMGCDVGSGFCKAAILEDPRQDPQNLLPDSLQAGMASTAYVSFDGTIEVYGVKRTAGKWPVRGVKTRLAEPVIEWSDAKGRVFRAEPAQVYGAIARDLVKLANETRVMQGKPPVYRLLVTYPADFKDRPDQLSRIKESIESVELDGHPLRVCRMLSEPAARAVDYAYYVRHLASQPITAEAYTVLVYDLGDGTFDTAVVTTYANGARDCDLVCQSGDAEIGGRKFDQLICAELERQIHSQLGPSVSINREYLRAIAVEMKHELSEADISERDVPLGDGEARLSLTREDFEALILPQIRQTLNLVQSQMEEAQAKGTMVDAIILAGGSSRIPLIRRMLEELTDHTMPVELWRPGVGVAYGAARAAYDCRADHQKSPPPDTQTTTSVQNGDKKVLTQHCERSCGVQIGGKVYFLLDEDAQLPCVSKPMPVRTAPSCTTTFRLRRARNRMPGVTQAESRDCADIRWLSLELPADQACTLTMKMDENRCITLECALSDGRAIEKNTFQDDNR